MKKLCTKANNGITLIALVITIIVLLILAGVAINMAIDSDGLFGKANEAVEGWNTAVENEKSEIQDLLNELGVKEPLTLPAGWDSKKVADLITETVTLNEEQITRNAPIPKGYVASGIDGEDTISDGLVIYQGTDPVTGEKNSTVHTTAMTTRNQFVWIPVDDINYMVMCKSNSSGSVCNVVLQEDETLKCETHDTTDLYGRFYDAYTNRTDYTSEPMILYSSMDFENRGQTWSDTYLREPVIVTGNSGTDYDGVDSNLTEIGFSAMDNKTVQQVFLDKLKEDFTSMVISIAKYGGFYVSRYEIGANGASLKNQKVLVAGNLKLTGHDVNTFIDGGNWYRLYNTLRNSTSIDNTAVSSHMIWGNQYDMIIKFLEEDSTNEPQFGHAARQFATQKLTGESLTDVMSNIYDLEGNNFEFTVQANYSDCRVYRGGSFNELGFGKKLRPASESLRAELDYTLCALGSRMTLYL